MNISFYLNNIKRFNKNSKRFLPHRFFPPWIDEIISFVLFGACPDDYFRYEFYKKSFFERSKFLTYRKSQKVIKKYNAKEFRQVFDDKVEFNKRFHDFIHREWLDMRTTSEKEFQLFLEKHEKVIMKPGHGGQGRGIFVVTKEDKIDVEKYREYIAEEFIVQHVKMSEINASSVNTVRVWTFNGKIIGTALRTGGDGAVVDNLHSQGVCGYLDERYGVITHPCIDNDLRKYIVHPSSGIRLVGFEVPNWQKVLADVKKIVNVVPEVKYVGWDIAIVDDGIELIEGNYDPGHDLMQMVIQNGCLAKFGE